MTSGQFCAFVGATQSLPLAGAQWVLCRRERGLERMDRRPILFRLFHALLPSLETGVTVRASFTHRA